MKAAAAATTCVLISVLACAVTHAETVRTLYLDDDIFTGSGADADYTGAAALTIATDSLGDVSPGLDRWLAGLDLAPGLHPSSYRYEMEIGAAAFTPADIAAHESLPRDRPYAGLIYASGAVIATEDARSAVTALTVGVLGTELIPGMHRGIHRAMGSIPPNGWRHQISRGGEPTFRLTHERIWESTPEDFAGGRLQWVYRAAAGIGYLTDLSAGVAARFGQFSDAGWGIHSSPTGLSDRSVFAPATDRERFFYGSLTARVPLHNVLLQGQFRDSDVTVRSADRRQFVPDLTLGFVVGLPRNRGLHYFVRAQRSDVRLPDRSDTMVYGGVSFSW